MKTLDYVNTMDEAEVSRVKEYVERVYSENPHIAAQYKEDVQRKKEQSKGQETKICSLPMEDTVWVITVEFVNHKTGGEEEEVTEHRFLSVLDRKGICVNMSEEAITTCSLEQHSYNLLCYCILFPMTGQPRRPRLVTFKDTDLASSTVLDLSSLGIKYVHPGLSPQSLDPDIPWMRECSLCRLRGTKDLFKQCGSCEAVIYCSRECQKRCWSQKGEMNDHSHKLWCDKMKRYMSKTEELSKFPFFFATETTSFDFNIWECKKFLEKRGVYNQGLWKRECVAWTIPGQFIPFGEMPMLDDPIVLPVESSNLDEVPTNKVPSLLEPISNWEAYYSWRGLHLDSPVAVLLHIPLTIYYILTTHLPRDYPGMKLCSGESYTIDLVGVEKEVEMMAVLKELGNLLPDIKLKIHMMGTEISKQVHRKVYKERNISVAIHRKLYHKYEGPRSHLAIGLNAGLGAYMTWAPSLRKLKVNNIPAYFTDYCQYSCECAKIAVERSKFGSCSQPEINPFRSPFRKVCEENNMPWYSNGFLFRILFDEEM